MVWLKRLEPQCSDSFKLICFDSMALQAVIKPNSTFEFEFRGRFSVRFTSGILPSFQVCM